MRPILLLALAILATGASAQTDPNLWLEQVDSPKALDWVKAENAKTLGTLQADPRYQPTYDTALALAQASDRIPTPELRGGEILNFWQDAAHVQGIWRRTDSADYRTDKPSWQTVLDLDALSTQEGKHWVWKGDTCWHPDDKICLIDLSDGGEDASVSREFDLVAGSFVKDGFSIPRAKHDVAWEDQDTLLVSTDWGQGSMTESGYPFIVKRLQRGQTLDKAAEIFRGTPKDVEVSVSSYVDGQGHHVAIVTQALDAFRAKLFTVQATGTIPLDLPEKIDLYGMLNGYLIGKVNEDFGPIRAGSLFALDTADPKAKPRAIFTPTARQSIEDAAVTKNRIVANVLDNVRGRALVFAPDGSGGWSERRLALPDNVSVSIATASHLDDEVYVEVEGFLQPTSLFAANLAAEAAPEQVKSLPAKFDASKDTVEQFETPSKDGTKIPYFVVHPKDMKLDGSNPTLLYAYGGFQVSMLPTYSPSLGKLWLEPGGVYVLANIRGGGEFGPAWHEAGLKTKRQRIYDDFAAVGEDLIARKITSPRRLGIRGGSNGGLLMGVEFEQHPDLWHAVIIDVPLLDMVRFEQIAAGASWVGEYGSVKNPDERAFLTKISPYHNLKAGTAYPEPFIFTTTKDDRVGPVHARKFAAKMKAMGLPYLYYEAIEGGHAAGANLREAAVERALEYTYLKRKLVD